MPRVLKNVFALCPQFYTIIFTVKLGVDIQYLLNCTRNTHKFKIPTTLYKFKSCSVFFGDSSALRQFMRVLFLTNHEWKLFLQAPA